MPRTYQEAAASTMRHVGLAMAKFHPHLKEVGVTLAVLHASGPRDEGGHITAPAIEARGQKAMACIKVTNLKDRAAGLADAVLIVDGDECQEWDEATWDALIDHELTHLDLQAGKTDDLGRPVLKTRHHDFEVGGFYTVSERHKEKAVEVESVKNIGSNLIKQGSLPGF